MPADPDVYQSVRIAAAYATDRPAVHPVVCARIRGLLADGQRFGTALDVGCGAGASTAALLPHADHVIGVDPFPDMLRHARRLVPDARFVQGRLESLPFERETFDLVAAAGAINYADLDLALSELARVLKPGGWLAAYDFSAGRRLTVDSALPELYARFRHRYPSPPGYALDLSALPLSGTGLSLLRSETFTTSIAMTHERYVEYLLSETGVEWALRSGTLQATVRRECAGLFGPVFDKGPAQVAFDVQLAVMQRSPTLAA